MHCDYSIETEKDGQARIAPSAIEDVTPPAGRTLVSVPLIHLSGRSIRANMMLDEGVITFIDSEAKRRGMTRTSYVEWMAHRIARQEGDLPGLVETEPPDHHLRVIPFVRHGLDDQAIADKGLE